MAEKHIEKRNYFAILKEMFIGKDAALPKYAKVRYTQYEMNLWKKKGLPLGEVDAVAKAYFSKRFLDGGRIDQVPKKALDKAFESLNFAVGKNVSGGGSGCYKRCSGLVAELNETLAELGLRTIDDPESFLDWLTFDYHVPKDGSGNPAQEPGYGFEIRIFHDDENLKDFKAEVKSLIDTKRQMSMQDIYTVISYKRKKGKIVKK